MLAGDIKAPLQLSALLKNRIRPDVFSASLVESHFDRISANSEDAFAALKSTFQPFLEETRKIETGVQC